MIQIIALCYHDFFVVPRLKVGLHMLGLHDADMLAIVPGPPIGLIIVWQVQKHDTTHT